MAQTGYSPLLIYSSSTASNTPSTSNLTNSTLGSELAINIADGKLFYKDSGGSIQVIAWKTTPTSAGGTGLTTYTAGDLPYYASGTALSKLGIGSSGTFLTSSGTAPQWSTASSVAVTSLSFGSTGLTPSTATQGAITVAGTLAAANGGTGQSSYTVGDILYASSTTALSKLSDVATGNALISGGTSTAPSWGKIGLTTHVSGTLAVGNGGTGLTSVTANYIPYGNGTSALNTSSTFIFNGTNFVVGLTAPYTTGTDIATFAKSQAAVSQIVIDNQTSTGTSGFLFSAYGGSWSLQVPGSSSFVNPLKFIFGSTEFARFSASGGLSLNTTTDAGAGNLLLGTGNLVQGTAAKGINFTANTASSGSTSQLLNWYEEGTWTPNQGSGLTVVGTFSSSGKYTRIGRLVTVQGSISATSITISGTASQISSNLPFSAATAYSGSMFNASTAGFGGVAASSTIVYATSTMTSTSSITFSVTYNV